MAPQSKPVMAFEQRQKLHSSMYWNTCEAVSLASRSIETKLNYTSAPRIKPRVRGYQKKAHHTFEYFTAKLVPKVHTWRLRNTIRQPVRSFTSYCVSFWGTPENHIETVCWKRATIRSDIGIRYIGIYGAFAYNGPIFIFLHFIFLVILLCRLNACRGLK